MLKGLDHLLHEEKLRQLGLFSLEKFQGDFSVYRYLKRGYREDGATRLFLVVPGARTRGNRYKLEQVIPLEHKEMLF